MASRGSGRRTAGGRARHRVLVHLIGRVRGGYLGPGSCPLESVRDMETETRALALCGPRCPVWVTEPGGNGLNGTNGAPGFRILAALRNWNLARPYFRGRRALAVACPRGQRLGERPGLRLLPARADPSERHQAARRIGQVTGIRLGVGPTQDVQIHRLADGAAKGERQERVELP